MVFDLAEALNIGWGLASGEGVTSIRDVLRDRSFRKRLVGEFEQKEAVSTSPAALKVAKSRQFLAWLAGGAESPLDQYLDDAQLNSFGITDSDRAVQVGNALRESMRTVSMQYASWAERQILADTNSLQLTLGAVEELLAHHLLERSSRAFATHGRYLAQLQSRRGGQFSGRHDYIPPADGHPSHPEMLWGRLSAGGGVSILIKGVGGSGKTRLLVEVAGHAQRSGWHVVHVLSQVPATVDDLAAVVLASDRPVLVVMDYPNELDDIDLSELSDRLIPDANAAGITLALLAAARPGWLATAPSLGPFETIALDNSDEHQAHVSHHIALDIAPTAAAQLGEAEFRRVVGTRPMIATIIARELEQGTTKGPLTARDTSSVRSGNLTDWLRRRFDDDGYASVRPRKLAETRTLPAPLCVAAAIAASTPTPTEFALASAAGAALSRDTSDPEKFAQRTLRHLLEAGWVADSAGQLASIHDTVVDHLIAEVVESDIHNGSSSYGEAAFGTSVSQLPTTANLFLHLRRYVLDPGASNAISRDERSSYVIDWINDAYPHVHDAIMASSDGNLVAAIRFLLDQRIWGPDVADLVEQSWREWLTVNHLSPTAGAVLAPLVFHNRLRQTEWVRAFVEAWLLENAHKFEARPILARLLTGSSRVSDRYFFIAVRTWVSEHGDSPEAASVLAPLLHHGGLRRERWVFEAVETWLALYGTLPEASIVLARVIEYAAFGRTPEAQRAIQAWLEKHGAGLGAAALLSRLLESADLQGTEWTQTATREWLDLHGTSPTARVVLVRLLEQPQLRATTWTVSAIQRWLSHHGTSVEAGVLLEHSDPRINDWAEPAIRTWLSHHGTTLDARALLEHTNLRDSEWFRDATRDWLASNGTTLEARALLEHTNLRDAEWAEAAVQTWLAVHGTTLEARALLEHAGVGSESAENTVHTWLELHGTTETARPLLVRLLGHAELRRTEWLLAATRRWLQANPTELNTRAVLHALLTHAALGQLDWVQSATSTWLAHHRTHPTARAVRGLLNNANRAAEGPWAALLDWKAPEPGAHG